MAGAAVGQALDGGAVARRARASSAILASIRIRSTTEGPKTR